MLLLQRAQQSVRDSWGRRLNRPAGQLGRRYAELLGEAHDDIGRARVARSVCIVAGDAGSLHGVGERDAALLRQRLHAAAETLVVPEQDFLVTRLYSWGRSHGNASIGAISAITRGCLRHSCLYPLRTVLHTTPSIDIQHTTKIQEVDKNHFFP